MENGQATVQTEDGTCYTLRKACDRDEGRILSLYHSLVGTDGCTWSDAYPTIDNVREDVQCRSLYCLTDDKERIIAAAFAGKTDELNHLKWNAAIKTPCDLARIGVQPDLHRRGIGAFLLRRIIADVKSRGFDGMRLLVSKTNPAAIALYDKNGFSRVGEAEMYGLDFYCYELSFSGF